MRLDPAAEPAASAAPPAPVRPSVSVIVPCCNEAPGLEAFLGRLAAVMGRSGLEHELLVVDDGSTDGTAAAAEKSGVRVLRHPENRGYGAALLTGIAAARHDWVATIDGDGQFAPRELLKLLAQAPGADMVVGRRGGASLWGSPGWAVLRWCQLRLSAFVAGRAVPDPNSGLRLVRREALARSLPVVCLGFSFSTTLTLSFLAGERAVVFVPVECAPAGVSSKVRLVRDVLISLRMMFLVLLHFKPLKLAAALGALLAAAALLGGLDVRDIRVLFL